MSRTTYCCDAFSVWGVSVLVVDRASTSRRTKVSSKLPSGALQLVDARQHLGPEPRVLRLGQMRLVGLEALRREPPDRALRGRSSDAAPPSAPSPARPRSPPPRPARGTCPRRSRSTGTSAPPRFTEQSPKSVIIARTLSPPPHSMRRRPPGRSSRKPSASSGGWSSSGTQCSAARLITTSNDRCRRAGSWRCCTGPSTNDWFGPAHGRASSSIEGCASSPTTSSGRNEVGDRSGELPRAAAQVEHPLVALERQRREERGVEDAMVAGIGRVAGAVPLQAGSSLSETTVLPCGQRSIEGCSSATSSIVGGGFGGAYAARELERTLGHRSERVVLVTPENFLLFSPLLAEAASGTIEPRPCGGAPPADAEEGRTSSPARWTRSTSTHTPRSRWTTPACVTTFTTKRSSLRSGLCALDAADPGPRARKPSASRPSPTRSGCATACSPSSKPRTTCPMMTCAASCSRSPSSAAATQGSRRSPSSSPSSATRSACTRASGPSTCAGCSSRPATRCCRT